LARVIGAHDGKGPPRKPSGGRAPWLRTRFGYDAHARVEEQVSAGEQILLIGFGNMGQALVRGWLAKGRSPQAIRVVDPVPAARAAAAELGISATSELASSASAATDVVVLAVKPNQLAAVLPAAAQHASRRAVFLSIAAGKTIAQLAAGLGRDVAIVRAMPNTPAAIGRGMTALVGSAAVTPAQRALSTALLEAVGGVAWLDDERYMDAVTAVSGSGPAYVFLLIECLETAARELGLDAPLARQLALGTVAGAAAYAAAAGEPATELRRRVTSPNGTTQAALDVLLGDAGLQALLTRAVQAAARRSRELSRE
jgi:pyrroline-5-carboxylate reductase